MENIQPTTSAEGTKQQRYVLLGQGDKVKAGDEIFYFGGIGPDAWLSLRENKVRGGYLLSVGDTYREWMRPARRKAGNGTL